MVLKFGAKLDSAKKFIESFIPPVLPEPVSQDDDFSPGIDPSQGSLSLFIRRKSRRRIFEVLDELSPNGKALENLLNTTVDQIGRSLDDKEKMTIIYRFISKHVFGADS